MFLRPQRSGNDVVELWCMPKQKHDGGLLLFPKLPKNLRRLPSRQQQIRPSDFLLGIAKLTRKNLRRLYSAHVRACQEQIARHSERRHALRHLFGLLDAFLRQIPFWVRRTFRIFAVNGDPVPNDVELHPLLLFSSSPLLLFSFSRSTPGVPGASLSTMPALAGNTASHGIPFRTVPRCDSRPANLQRHRPARVLAS